jgi:pimeloyl-ACP methyl ester carboxylesterase
MSEAKVHFWTASDGIRLAYHELGDGRPVILLHGLFSDAYVNWIKFGHAERIASDGFQVIMPDLRAHGQSGKPHGEQFYPRGILARDLRELIAYLALTEFDLGGFSLGARTTVEGVGEGLRPRRAILGGAGLEGLRNWKRRKTFFLEAIDLFDKALRGYPVHEKPARGPHCGRRAARQLRGCVHDLARGLHHADTRRLRVRRRRQWFGRGACEHPPQCEV